MATQTSDLEVTEDSLTPEERRTGRHDRRRGERRASERNHRDEVLTALLEISNYVGSVMSLDGILERIVEVTRRVMNAPTCSIYLWNEDRSRVVMRCNIGLEKGVVGTASFERGKGIPGIVAVEGNIIAVPDGRKDPRYAPISSTMVRDFHAYLCAPLRIQEDIIGVLTLRKNEVHEFTADELTTCETICKQVAIVVEKARLYNARIEAEKLAAVAVSLSGVAHYIKNLLVSMRGSEYLVESGIKRQDFRLASEGWAVLKRSTSKIRDLVENMLNYYRETELHPRPVDLNAFILENLQNLEDRAMERLTTLTPDLDLRLEKVEFDPDAFQDVMINLISNAIDAIPEGRKGIVKVQTRLLQEEGKDGQALISVRDNGSGINPEDQAKMFNLFFSTKGKRGTGIGLAASRRIILDHNGAIEFESELDIGTEFKIRIPLRQPAHSA